MIELEDNGVDWDKRLDENEIVIGGCKESKREKV